MRKYIEHVGNTWINGKSVIAYQAKDGGVQFGAETAGGKSISPLRTVSADEYARLKAEWVADSTTDQDINVTARALRYVGIDV